MGGAGDWVGGFGDMIELQHVRNFAAHIFCVADPINPEKSDPRNEETWLAWPSWGLSINAVVMKERCCS